VEDYRALGVYLDNRLDWKCNTEAVFKNRDRADSDSYGSLGPSVLAPRCCMSSISLWWRVHLLCRSLLGQQEQSQRLKGT